MKKIITLHRAPADVDAFMAHYRDTHLLLAARIPGLVRTEVTQVTQTLLGEERNFLRAELYFTDEGFGAAMTSPELAAFARGLVTVPPA